MMEQQPENNTAQTDSVAGGSTVSLGQTLREAREGLGFSVADVAAQIKFAPRQIEALEADDYKSLPETAFVRGFVRSYAKILKLDAQELLSNLTKAKSVSGELTPASVDVPFPDDSWGQKQNLIWLGVALLLAVLVVVFAVWNYTSGSPVMQKTKSVETPVPLPAEIQASQTVDEPAADSVAPSKAEKGKSAATEPVEKRADRNKSHADAASEAQSQPVNVLPKPDLPPNPGSLRLEFDEESWIEIKDRDGSILKSQVYQPGEDAIVQGNMPFTVLIGHAPSVRLYFKDKQVDLAPFTRQTTDVAFLKLE